MIIINNISTILTKNSDVAPIYFYCFAGKIYLSKRYTSYKVYDDKCSSEKNFFIRKYFSGFISRRILSKVVAFGDEVKEQHKVINMYFKNK